MAKAGTRKGGLSDRIRGGLEGSRKSLERIESEGEKLLKSMMELADKYVPDSQLKAVEDLGQDARRLFVQWNQAIEENTKKVVDALNVPTKKDLEVYNRRLRDLVDEHVTARIEKLKVPTGRDFEAMGRQLRANVEEQAKKLWGQLNIATRKDVDAVAKEVKAVRKDVDKLMKGTAPRKTAATQKKAAPQKKAPPKKKAAAKKKARS